MPCHMELYDINHLFWCINLKVKKDPDLLRLNRNSLYDLGKIRTIYIRSIKFNIEQLGQLFGQELIISQIVQYEIDGLNLLRNIQWIPYKTFWCVFWCLCLNLFMHSLILFHFYYERKIFRCVFIPARFMWVKNHRWIIIYSIHLNFIIHIYSII